MKLQKPLIILSALALAATLIGLTGTNLAQSLVIGSQSSTISALSGNSDALREQVKAAGEVPVAPPAKVIVREAPSPGKDGSKGDTGLPGRAPTAEEISLSVAVYCSIRVDCQGSPGAPSTVPGPDGAAGADGADSTIPGPMGPASTAPGPKGYTGDDGADGKDGEPAYSWTQSDFKGDSETCSRTTPFDKTAPTYECAPTSTPGVTP